MLAQLPRITPGVHIPMGMGGFQGHRTAPLHPLMKECRAHMEHRAPYRAEALLMGLLALKFIYRAA